MRRGASSRFVVAFATAVAVGAALALPAGGVRVAAAQGPWWRQLPPSGALYGAVGIVDAAAGRMVLHEGETDTFTPPVTPIQLDLTTLRWQDWAAGGTRPVSKRFGRGVLGGPAVMDETERVVLALCDCVGGDAFELDLATDRWRQVQGRDADRIPAALLYDATSDRAIGFGGREFGFLGIMTRTVAYDLGPERSGWSELPPVPFRLSDQAVAVDPEHRQAYAFGGRDANDGVVDSLWRLDLAAVDQATAWTLVGAAGPTARMSASLTYIGEHRMLLFGGYRDGAYMADAWTLDASVADAPVWSSLSLSQSPPARAAHAAAWDEAGDRLVIVGGTSGSDLSTRVLADAWALEFGDRPPVAVFLPIAYR